MMSPFIWSHILSGSIMSGHMFLLGRGYDLRGGGIVLAGTVYPTPPPGTDI